MPALCKQQGDHVSHRPLWPKVSLHSSLIVLVTVILIASCRQTWKHRIEYRSLQYVTIMLEVLAIAISVLRIISIAVAPFQHWSRHAYYCGIDMVSIYIYIYKQYMSQCTCPNVHTHTNCIVYVHVYIAVHTVHVTDVILGRVVLFVTSKNEHHICQIRIRSVADTESDHNIDDLWRIDRLLHWRCGVRFFLELEYVHYSYQ